VIGHKRPTLKSDLQTIQATSKFAIDKFEKLPTLTSEFPIKAMRPKQLRHTPLAVHDNLTNRKIITVLRDSQAIHSDTAATGRPGAGICVAMRGVSGR
jgi:hypothetical protein